MAKPSKLAHVVYMTRRFDESAIPAEHGLV